MAIRNGEEEKTWFRTDRFFCVDNKWYFSTREGTSIGPYHTKEDARQGMALYVEHMTKTGGEGESVAHKIATSGRWSATHFQ